AWRLVHIGAGCLANRASAFFSDGSVPADADMFDRRHVPTALPTSAAEGIAFLEHAYRRWHDGIAALDDAGLQAPLGPRGAQYAAEPMAGLILHINREVMHHGGETARSATPTPPPALRPPTTDLIPPPDPPAT